MATFDVLRALHAIVGDALDDIERVFEDAAPPSTPPPTTTTTTSGYTTPPTSPSTSTPRKARHTPTVHFQTPTPCTSPPPSPSTSTPKASRRTFPSSVGALDFPSLDSPSPSSIQTQSIATGMDSTDAEHLISTSPVIGAAINRIVSACGQMSATVRDPFLSLCDASLAVSFFPFRSVCLFIYKLDVRVSPHRHTLTPSVVQLFILESLHFLSFLPPPHHTLTPTIPTHNFLIVILIHTHILTHSNTVPSTLLPALPRSNAHGRDPS